MTSPTVTSEADRQKQALVKRLQEGRARAKRERPKRLRELEAQLDALGREFRSLPAGHSRRSEIIRELRPMGEKRSRLRYSDA